MNSSPETAAAATAHFPCLTKRWAGRALGFPGVFVVQEPNFRPVVFINSFLAQEDKQVSQP